MTALHCTVKRALYAALDGLGVNAGLRRALRRRLLVVCYHEIIAEGRPPASDCEMPLEEFREQIEMLARLFHPVSAGDVLQWARGRERLPDFPALVTFDDGLRNNLTCAAPVLQRLGVPALLHVATGYIGARRRLWTSELTERVQAWEGDRLPMPDGRPDVLMPRAAAARRSVADCVRETCKLLPVAVQQEYLERLTRGAAGSNSPRPLGEGQGVRGSENRRSLGNSPHPGPLPEGEGDRFLTWDEVRQLQRCGFAIGAHTVNHRSLASLGAEDQDRELRESKATVERELGAACPWVAYPFGGRRHVGPAVLRRAAAAGFEVGFVLEERINPARPDPLAIDRICPNSREWKSIFRARTSGLYHYLHPRSNGP